MDENKFTRENSGKAHDDNRYTYEVVGLATGYVSKAGHRTLVSGMTASLERGVLTCLIGVNGAGKSTLLRTLAGLQSEVGGEIRLMGRGLKDYTPKELARCVSVVLTDDIPEQNLTAEELVGMGRMPYTGYWGALNEADHRVVRDSLLLVGMENFAHRRIGELSDGERQKLMIAKALAQDTDVILLDEPVAFLDFPSKVAVLRLLSRVAREKNRSILLSIHDIELALQTAGSLWLLTGSDFVAGNPRELAREGRIDFLFEGEGIRFDRSSMQYTLEAD